jgi:putative SOS response-associated peptidase YedK
VCGRFALRSRSAIILSEMFRAMGIPAWSPRYNIASTQKVLAVRLDEQGERQWASLS